MTTRPGIRRSPAGHARPPRLARGPRRASRGLSPVRAAAALVALLSVLAVYGVGASSVFAYGRLVVDDRATLLTDPAVVEQRVGLTTGSSNLFLVRADDIASALRELPTVTDAQVTVDLPDTLRIHLLERQPILAWVVGNRRFVVDRDGVIFAVYPADAPGPSTSLPAVTDERATSTGLAVGGRLDPVDLDAATRLGSLTPADIGSAKKRLLVSVDDADGYVVRPSPGGPIAVFGFYTPTLRPPAIIPGQVRLLRSLIAGREPSVLRVVLASDTSGTYVPRSSPAAGASPGASGGASAAP
jgi:cell division septal protein FtsQ